MCNKHQTKGVTAPSPVTPTELDCFQVGEETDER